MTTRPRTTAGLEQLSLLAVSELPVQFRLDRQTRERGLAHVAEIRRLLAARHDPAPAAVTSTVHVTRSDDQQAA